MTTRGKCLAPLAAAAVLLLTACGGPSWSDQRRLEDYRSWLQGQPNVQSVDASLVAVSCDSCMFGPPYTGSVTLHLRSGTTAAQLTALGDTLRFHHDTVVQGSPAIPVVVDGLKITLGSEQFPAQTTDTVAIERENIALLDGVRQTHVPGVTGTIADGVVSLVTAEPNPVPTAITLTAPDSALTRAAAATRASAEAPSGRAVVPPGTIYLDIRGAGQDETKTMPLMVGNGPLPTKTRTVLTKMATAQKAATRSH